MENYIDFYKENRLFCKENKLICKSLIVEKNLAFLLVQNIYYSQAQLLDLIKNHFDVSNIDVECINIVSNHNLISFEY